MLCCVQYHVDGLVQERCNSGVLAMELHLSCTNQSMLHWTLMNQESLVWSCILTSVENSITKCRRPRTTLFSITRISIPRNIVSLYSDQSPRFPIGLTSYPISEHWTQTTTELYWLPSLQGSLIPIPHIQNQMAASGNRHGTSHMAWKFINLFDKSASGHCWNWHSCTLSPLSKDYNSSEVCAC